MSFYTDVSFTRPEIPPHITCATLASFLESFLALGLVSPRPTCVIQVKFGPSVDADDRGTSEEIEEVPGIFRVEDIDWSMEKYNLTSANMLALLRNQEKSIYRAFISLGLASDAFFDHMNAVMFKEPERSLALDSWSVGIGPVGSSNLESEGVVRVGWIELYISGYGYLWPTTWPQLVTHLESSPEIQRAMHLCRSTWPVASVPADAPTIAKRREMGALWGYPDQLDRPVDWHWTLRETG